MRSIGDDKDEDPAVPMEKLQFVWIYFPRFPSFLMPTVRNEQLPKATYSIDQWDTKARQ